METRTENPTRRDKSAYYARWYAENGEDVNAKRRERYLTDSEYREKVKDRARERKRALLAMRKGRVPRDIGGTVILVYPITWLCREADVTSQHIRDLEAKGWIPHATFDDMTRVYSEHQTKLILQLLAAIASGSKSGAIRARMQTQWFKGL